MMEADTCHEWDEAIIGKWMDCGDDATALPVRPPANVEESDDTAASESPSAHDDLLAIVNIAAKNTIETLTDIDLERHVQFLDDKPNRIHPDIDRRTLAALRGHLDRDLTKTECIKYRQRFAAALRSAHTGMSSPVQN